MTLDLEEILPQPESLEGEKVDKEKMVNEVIVIKDYLLLPTSFQGSDTSEFAVIQAEHKGKLITFSGGNVITEKLQSIGREQIRKNDGIRCRLVKVKSKKGGRHYFDLVSARK